MSVVLVVAAHPDDEVLGCGGTIAAHSAAGDEVHVMTLGAGIASRAAPGATPDARAARELAAAAREANAILGVRSLSIGDFPDNRMDAVAQLDIVKVVEERMNALRPSIVYTHHAGDLNVDHVAANRCVSTACRPQPQQTVRTLLFFEIPSSTGWLPGGEPFVADWIEDIVATLELKLDALRAYRSEMRAFPHARSIEAVEHLARLRGAMAGTGAAEAFALGLHRNLR